MLRDGEEVSIPIAERDARRPHGRAAGGEDPDRRRRRRRRVGGRPVDAHRRAGARRRRRRVRRSRGRRSTRTADSSSARRRSARRPRSRRSRASWPRRSPGRRRSSASSTASSGVFVPVVLGVALATLAGWLVAHRRRHGRVLRCRRRPDHRVPLRARPRDADRAHGRHGTRRAARDPHQGPRDPRAHAPDHDHRARQDRHGDRGADGARPGSSLLDGASREEVLRLAGAVEAASEHPIAQAVAAAARSELGELPPVTDFRNLPGHGVRRHGRGPRRRGRSPRRDDHRLLGRRAARRRSPSATPSSRRARRRSPSSRSSA